MRVTQWLFLFGSILWFVCGKLSYRLTKVTCTTSKQTVINETCYLKAYNRRSPVLNIQAFVIRHPKNPLVSYENFYKSSSSDSFTQFLKIEKMDFCGNLQDTSLLSTPLLSHFYKMATNIFEISDICAAIGLVKISNITFEKNQMLMMLFPIGFHQTIVHLFDDIDDNIMTITLWAYLRK